MPDAEDIAANWLADDIQLRQGETRGGNKLNITFFYYYFSEKKTQQKSCSRTEVNAVVQIPLRRCFSTHKESVSAVTSMVPMC